ncbi:hypothetical protein NDU88_004342 [Pleurodeles waltl]|uniref:tRNA selenocysteine-associated protein 1 n=1 Tax=Pleurodeles waltl TaxID=8319 RepID=A0AAV7VIL2_PLEWA|nr:hypothetical protein NDU88_004342 [Pleurodeles waltl]
MGPLSIFTLHCCAEPAVEDKVRGQKSARPYHPTRGNMTSVWMGDLEPYMTEDFIKQAFAAMGEAVVNVKVVSERIVSGKPGYCFVDLVDQASVERCLHRLNGLFIPGSNPLKKFRLNYSTYHKKHELTPDYSIFVGDLSLEVDDFQLYYFFLSKYPSCRGGKVVTDTLGNSRGYGFVKFGDFEEHKRALKECHLKTGLGTKPLRLSLAIPRRLKPESQQGQSYDYSQYYQQYANYYAKTGFDPYAGYSYTSYNEANAYPAETETTAVAPAGPEALICGVENSDCEEHYATFETLDTDALNKVYTARSEEFFDALINCHWQPLDTVTSEIPSTM